MDDKPVHSPSTFPRTSLLERKWTDIRAELDEILHWEEDDGIVFDDTYNHEVWNETNEERAILLLDVKRPMLQPLAALNDVLLGLFRHTLAVQNAGQNPKQWSEHLKQVEGANSDTPTQTAGSSERQGAPSVERGVDGK